MSVSGTANQADGHEPKYQKLGTVLKALFQPDLDFGPYLLEGGRLSGAPE